MSSLVYGLPLTREVGVRNGQYSRHTACTFNERYNAGERVGSRLPFYIGRIINRMMRLKDIIVVEGFYPAKKIELPGASEIEAGKSYYFKDHAVILGQDPSFQDLKESITLYNAGVVDYESNNFESAWISFYAATRGGLNTAFYLPAIYSEKVRISLAEAGKDTDKLLSEYVNDNYMAGVSAYTQGNPRKAIELWDKVLAVDPANSKARENMQKAVAQLK